jgi:hypothetical protein
MPYIWGLLTGILLTILVVFLIDTVDDPGARDFVNWDSVGEKLGASVKEASEKVREEVHDATAPKQDQPADPAPSQ